MFTQSNNYNTMCSIKHFQFYISAYKTVLEVPIIGIAHTVRSAPALASSSDEGKLALKSFSLLVCHAAGAVAAASHSLASVVFAAQGTAVGKNIVVSVERSTVEVCDSLQHIL